MTAVNGAQCVKDFGRLIWILTERDLLKAMAVACTRAKSACGKWMSRAITAAHAWEVEEAARIMSRTDSGTAVIDEGGQVTGVVSLRRVVAATNVASDPA